MVSGIPRRCVPTLTAPESSAAVARPNWPPRRDRGPAVGLADGTDDEGGCGDPDAPAEPVLSANAIGMATAADPIPNAAANRPTRPTYWAYPEAARSVDVTVRCLYSIDRTRPLEIRRCRAADCTDATKSHPESPVAREHPRWLKTRVCQWPCTQPECRYPAPDISSLSSGASPEVHGPKERQMDQICCPEWWSRIHLASTAASDTARAGGVIGQRPGL